MLVHHRDVHHRDVPTHTITPVMSHVYMRPGSKGLPEGVNMGFSPAGSGSVSRTVTSKAGETAAAQARVQSQAPLWRWPARSCPRHTGAAAPRRAAGVHADPAGSGARADKTNADMRPAEGSRHDGQSLTRDIAAIFAQRLGRRPAAPASPNHGNLGLVLHLHGQHRGAPLPPAGGGAHDAACGRQRGRTGIHGAW